MISTKQLIRLFPYSLTATVIVLFTVSTLLTIATVHSASSDTAYTGSTSLSHPTTKLIITHAGEDKTLYTKAETINEALSDLPDVPLFSGTYPYHTIPLTGQEQEVSITEPIPLTIIDGDITMPIRSGYRKVEDILRQHNISLREKDSVQPKPNQKVTAHSTIVINRAPDVLLVDGGKRTIITTAAPTVELVLAGQNITVGDLDRLVPDLDTIIKPGLEIKITRVVEKQTLETIDIPFPTEKQKDSELLLGTEKIIQYGQPGIKEQRSQITLEDGQEVKRKILDEKVIAEPVPHIVVSGTKLVIVSSEEGRASWYWNGDGPTAAHRTFPFGQKIKVTNKSNGKSVIAVINDRGPFIPGRIVDLNVPAFSAIAPLGQGTIPVRVERLAQ